MGKRADVDTCLTFHGTSWQNRKLKIQRPKRFIEEFNKALEKTKEEAFQPASEGLRPGLSLNVGGDKGGDFKLYMGGIPLTMKDEEVRRMCESFGILKSFNLVKDPQNAELNKGFAFFEYMDEKLTDKAIKALNNLEIMDKKLKVQKASVGQKPVQVSVITYSISLGTSTANCDVEVRNT